MNLEPLEAKLADPLWRMTSGELYKINPADGSGLQPFRPRPEQVEILEAIVTGKRKILKPKARRLGMSTALGIYAADCLLFRKGWQGSLIDQNAADASRKLDRIVRVALEGVPDWLRARVKVVKQNESQITLNVAGTGERSFYAGMNARGGSNDFLWISEWGVIQYEDPKRSGRIRSGALPSARHGVTVVETTWAGGPGGDVWELLEPSLTGQADDWLVMFSPWWIDPRNVNESAVIDVAAQKYFAKIAPRLAADGIVLTEQQRRWWAAERREQGVFMQRENPTFLDECWSAPVQGAIYAELIEQARAEGRIATFPVDGSSVVHTSWDIGSPRNTVCWYWQVVGREIRIIDCDRGFEGTTTQRVAMMRAKGYSFGSHYLPHDADAQESGGNTMAGDLRQAGLMNVVVLPRTHSVWVGINKLTEMFPGLAFRSPACDDGIAALSSYRMRKEGQGALQKDELVHDWASHPADALRMMAEAVHAGYVKWNAAPGTVTACDPWGDPVKNRRGMKPMRVSA